MACSLMFSSQSSARATQPEENVRGLDMAQQSQPKVIINGTGVRLRKGPGTNYDFLKWENGAARSPKKGAKLTYLGEEGNWYKVSYEKGTYYVSKDFSYLDSTASPAKKEAAKTAQPAEKQSEVVITGNGVRLRKGPGLDYDYLKWENGGVRSPKKGTRVKYLGSEGDWYKVSYAGGVYYLFKQYGYIAK